MSDARKPEWSQLGGRRGGQGQPVQKLSGPAELDKQGGLLRGQKRTHQVHIKLTSMAPTLGTETLEWRREMPNTSIIQRGLRKTTPQGLLVASAVR